MVKNCLRKKVETNEEKLEEFQNRQKQSLHENRTSSSIHINVVSRSSILLLDVLTRNDLLGEKTK